MLRIHRLPQWYALLDQAMKIGLYEIVPIWQFAHPSLLDAIPVKTTALRFPRPAFASATRNGVRECA
jgi:hypothetical protein